MANLSSVITQTVGTSTAGVNLITAANDSTIWTASTITKSTTTTAAELPLGPAIPTATKFALAASPGSAYCDFDCPSSLLNTKLGLGWFARASASFTATITLTLQSFASSSNRTAGTSPTTVNLQTSTVQGLAPSFWTSFDSNSQQYYRLTINFTGLAAAWYAISQVQVGPGTRDQGAAIGEWQSHGGTNQGWNWSPGTGGQASSYAYWRRVGSVMHVRGGFQTGASGASVSSTLIWTLPSGYTIDSSKSDAATNDDVFGIAHILDGGVAHKATGLSVYSSSTSIQFFIGDTNITPTYPHTWAVGGDAIWFEANIPIAEWAGSTVNLGSAGQVEYAWNSDTSNASTTTSGFSYGPSGVFFGSFDTVTRAKRCRFQYPIQDTDQIELEIYDSSNGGRWMPANLTINASVGATTGITLRPVNSTDVDVEFASGGYAATPRAVASAWSGIAGAFKWRLKKFSPGVPCGFGMANSNESGLVKPRKGQYPLTVTSSLAGWTTGRAVGVYYQDQDGNHRLKFNITGSVSSVTTTANTLTVSGVTFKSGSNHYQACCGSPGVAGLGSRAYTIPGASTLTIDHASATLTLYGVSGDVELESKPTWA